MNSRYASRSPLAILFAVILALPFLTMSAATQSGGSAKATVNVEVANGLRVVTFASDPGTIRVNLPNDIAAGDTISGTVVAEPKGNSNEERAKNSDTLEGLVVVVGNQKVPVSAHHSFVVTFPGLTASGTVITPDPKITQPTHPSGAIITPDPKITTPPNTTPPGGRVVPGQANSPDLPMSFFDIFIEPSGASGIGWSARASIPLGAPATHPSGAIITPDPKITPPMTPSGAIITPDPKITQPTHPSGAIITPDPKITPPKTPSGEIITIPGSTFGSTPMDRDFVPGFDIPPLGQTGRPIVVTGPFDGNSSNTVFNWTPDVRHGAPTGGGTVGTNSLNTAELLAESPREAVFEAPRNVTGPMDIKLKEGNVETTGTHRSVGVNLSAPKTSLIKGESTTLKVEVSGLQGITQPVPLTLQCTGVITMAGGIYQPLVIQPSQVGADGRYTTTRGITGVQAGGWGATATVVTHRFDVCLQDDSTREFVLVWNTFNGEYIFANPFPPKPPGQPPQTGDTTPLSLPGKGTIIMKGCILTLQHNAPDRRVFATLDTCTNTGSASVESSSPKVKFTITDRNTTDNTCAVQ